MPEINNTFKIGLCMAGAISAGAYTAGAIDYLIEALEEWQKRKDNNESNTPRHNVEIPIIGGASAGGMTGIIAASALQDEIEPVKELLGDIMKQQPSNKFYHSWVDLTDDKMLSILLNTDDITKNGLQSVLNADFIDKVAERAVKVSNASTVDRKYIANNLKVFVTLSNLEGMDFSIAFRSNSYKDKYVVSSYNDYACFKLCASENDYTNDGWIPLNFKTNLNVDVVKNAAMATGAFPVGLKARILSRGMKYMNDLEWFKHITRDANNPFKKDPYNTVNVDGGMINNEPFDKIRELLLGSITPQKLQDVQDYDKFDSTVLMIDPFPSETEKFDDSTKLTTIIGNTLGVLVGQARLKSSLLIDAMDSKKAGQFLIAPVRYEKKVRGEEISIEGKKAIACGPLDGFGGFISKEFRIHDYFLGRANCEKFLRDHFTVPQNTTNKIFMNGYSGITDKTQFTSKTDGGLQIIPIFTERRPSLYMPKFSNGKEYPAVTFNEISSYRKMLKARAEKVILNISKYSRTQRVLLWIGAKIVLNAKIADAVIDSVIESLEEHKLIRK